MILYLFLWCCVQCGFLNYTIINESLLFFLIYPLLAFLLFFAIQYLYCLIFKWKWLGNLFSIILIVEEAVMAALAFVATWNLMHIYATIYLIGPFACIAGAVVARLVNRWICKKKEKKAQALNPAQ